MCCGRGIKNAASRTYSSPSILSEEDMARKVARKAKQDKVKADLEKGAPPTPGAYYGNPIDKKQAKKLAAQSEKDQEDTAKRLADEEAERAKREEKRQEEEEKALQKAQSK